MVFAWLLLFAPEACHTGARLFAAQAWQQAQESLWPCVEAGAGNADRAWELAQTYRQLRNEAEGLVKARTVIERQPRSVDTLYVAAFLEFQSGRYDESIRLLGRAFQLNNFDWRVHQLFALNYVVLDIREGARHEFEVALKLRPRDPQIHYHLARLEYIENRFQESIAASQRALELSPDYGRVYENLGLCWEALGDNSKAETSYRKAIELSRRQGLPDEWPLLNYAAFLMKSTAPETSLPVLEEAVRLFPKSAKAHYYQGRAFRRLDRIPKAIASLERSCELDPADPDPHYVLATLLIRQGDVTRGKAVMEQFTRLRDKPRLKRNLLEGSGASRGPE